jgi:hypothetical protein
MLFEEIQAAGYDGCYSRVRVHNMLEVRLLHRELRGPDAKVVAEQKVSVRPMNALARRRVIWGNRIFHAEPGASGALRRLRQGFADALATALAMRRRLA